MNSDIAKTNEKKNTSRLLVNVKVDLYFGIEKTSFTYDTPALYSIDEISYIQNKGNQ